MEIKDLKEIFQEEPGLEVRFEILSSDMGSNPLEDSE